MSTYRYLGWKDSTNPKMRNATLIVEVNSYSEVVIVEDTSENYMVGSVVYWDVSRPEYWEPINDDGEE